MAHGHKAHHGHRQPEPSIQHAAKHDRQMAALDDHHGRYASSNRMENAHHHLNVGGHSTLSAGGSSKMHQGGKGAGLVDDGGPSQMKTLRRIAGGRPDTAGGKNTA